tara:strand:- start:466 stop:1275 length:810 start_codon:yes stop_codon:yes gene_type:complete
MAVAVADEPPLHLLSLSDDLLYSVCASLDFAAATATTTACKHLSSLAASEVVWRRLVENRWPLVTAPQQGWRALHLERAQLPRWQHLFVRMDEVERLLAALANGWEGALASEMLGIAAGAVPHGHAGFDAWCGRVGLALALPQLDGLHAWARGLSTGLDSFYEAQEGGAVSHDDLRSALLRALRGLSALWLLWRHVVSPQDAANSAAVAARWGQARLPEAMRQLEEDLESLRLEGFSIAVPQSMRPPGMPRSHGWWYLGPPVVRPAYLC